jgi:hypothetical protein
MAIPHEELPVAPNGEEKSPVEVDPAAILAQATDCPDITQAERMHIMARPDAAPARLATVLLLHCGGYDVPQLSNYLHLAQQQEGLTGVRLSKTERAYRERIVGELATLGPQAALYAACQARVGEYMAKFGRDYYEEDKPSKTKLAELFDATDREHPVLARLESIRRSRSLQDTAIQAERVIRFMMLDIG